MNMDSISHAPTPIYSHGRHSTAYAIQKHKIGLSCYDSLRAAYRFKDKLKADTKILRCYRIRGRGKQRFVHLPIVIGRKCQHFAQSIICRERHRTALLPLVACVSCVRISRFNAL